MLVYKQGAQALLLSSAAIVAGWWVEQVEYYLRWVFQFPLLLSFSQQLPFYYHLKPHVVELLVELLNTRLSYRMLS